MVDNPGKSQLIPAMMVIVLLDLTNKVQDLYIQAAVVRGNSQYIKLHSQHIVQYKVRVCELTLLCLFSTRLTVSVGC